VPGKTRPHQIENEEHGFDDDDQDPEFRQITMNKIGIVIERQSNNEGGNDERKRIRFWRAIHAFESNDTQDQPPRPTVRVAASWMNKLDESYASEHGVVRWIA
jgi:hypothetical protein